MKKNHNEILKKVDEWLSFGDDDLRLARHGLRLDRECPFRLIAYHAQQCVEKHIKAYLVFHQVDFPYTHNISRLLELCDQNTATNWVEELKEAEELTAFAITTRYPGQDEEVTKDEAETAVNVADRVREIVRTALRK
ncbi:MAG: hypothetical protein AMJ79_04505 [Phycisphaerae bacterium SM23_30]|nr:MAG: hypothetical protein AMJ79_04505 [Phycisphaerae bacterium SM23_30]